MKILICDDEQTYLNTLHIHVEEYMLNHHIPCTVTALTDPTKVAIDTAVFDLAFLDIQMPGVDGIALAKHLRQNNPKLALFFVTNYDEYQDEAMDLRAFRFFEKPFNANRLYAGLDKAMEYINTLRDNRIIDNVPLVASDNKDALVKVLEERRREMPMLGCTRLIDLKRLNREPEFAKTIVHEVNGVEYRLEPNSPKYILPIPPSVLRFNPDMIPNIR